MTREPVAAAILAGGRARRFGGTVKRTLAIGGARIIDRQLGALRAVADPTCVVADDAAPFASLGLDVVPDLVAGGRPCLSAGLLARLARDRDADLVVPRGPRGYEPLCAVYSSACAEPMRRRLERGALKAAVLPEGVQVEEIGPEMLAACDPDGLLFVNVNTPHDYERARDLIESMPQRPGDRITDKHSAS